MNMYTNTRPWLGIALVSLLLTGPITRGDTIHDAIKDGDFARVQALVDSNREVVDKQDESGKSPLHLAIERGFSDIARYLIEQGADVNVPDSSHESPLHHCASRGNLEIGRLLLERGSTSINDSSVSKYDGFVGNWTPLHLACLRSHPAMTRLLLDYGADIEVRDGVQRTPLILSVESRDMQVVRVLVESGADVNAQAIRGYTPLLWAARNGFREMVDYLIDLGATIESDKLRAAFDMAVSNGMDKLLELVLQRGFNIAELAQRDSALICYAAAGGSPGIVGMLVDVGFNLEHADKDGCRPIHYAASEGHVDVIDYMLSRDVDMNARNMMGETAYNMAVKLRADQAAEYLKAKGADTSDPRFPILEGPYMGEQPPGEVPKMFLPGIVSGYYRAHSSVVFTPDGKQAYWAEMSEDEGSVKVSYMVDGRWSFPMVADIERDPSISPDGKRLYFIRTRPFKPGEEPGGDPDVKEEYWYKERTDTGWSAPVSVGEAVNALGIHWPCSIDRDGNLYFSEFKENMYFSEYVNGRYQEPVNLVEHFGNATLVGHSPFVSPEADYLLFSTDNGIHVSFKRQDGIWTDCINLGSEINGSHVNGSPRVSHDGRYMFYVSAGQNRTWGIYWVSTGFIDRLRAQYLKGE
jgi:ankyrin repeat protein